jgi:large subunit ribosomal protein L28
VKRLASACWIPNWHLLDLARGATTRRPGATEDIMAFACDYCGKTRQKAHKVSHSNHKTRKWQQPNLQGLRAVVQGKTQRVRACTRCIRSGRVTKAA